MVGECDVDGADRQPEGPGLPQPVHVPINLGPEIIDPTYILSDEAFADVPAGLRHQRRAGSVRGLAPAVETGFRIDSQQSRVVLDALDQEGAAGGCFHRPLIQARALSIAARW